MQSKYRTNTACAVIRKLQQQGSKSPPHRMAQLRVNALDRDLAVMGACLFSLPVRASGAARSASFATTEFAHTSKTTAPKFSFVCALQADILNKCLI
jgi:hypothetical protein